MNEKQMKVLWIVVVIVCLMVLFPVREGGHSERARGFLYYDKITVRRGELSITFKAGVDLETLIAQMIPVIAIGAGLMISLRDKKD